MRGHMGQRSIPDKPTLVRLAKNRLASSRSQPREPAFSGRPGSLFLVFFGSATHARKARRGTHSAATPPQGLVASRRKCPRARAARRDRSLAARRPGGGATGRPRPRRGEERGRGRGDQPAAAHRCGRSVVPAGTAVRGAAGTAAVPGTGRAAGGRRRRPPNRPGSHCPGSAFARDCLSSYTHRRPRSRPHVPGGLWASGRFPTNPFLVRLAKNRLASSKSQPREPAFSGRRDRFSGPREKRPPRPRLLGGACRPWPGHRGARVGGAWRRGGPEIAKQKIRRLGLVVFRTTLPTPHPAPSRPPPTGHAQRQGPVSTGGAGRPGTSRSKRPDGWVWGFSHHAAYPPPPPPAPGPCKYGGL